MKKIPLTQNKYAIVDDEDYPYISRFKWTTGVNGHAVRCMKMGKEGQVMMEYFIKSKGRGPRYIYKNHNCLDLRKENLEVVSWGLVSVWGNKTKSKTTSKYKGVYWDKRAKKWFAYLTARDKNGKRNKLLWQSFENENDAALARNKKALEVYGVSAYQNEIR